MSILDVKDVTQIFGDKKLFSHADMQLFGGDKMGLTGLNGAGKSTFIKILPGEILPDQGDVRWNPRVRLGCLDQQASIRRSMTVWAYLDQAFEPLYALEQQLAALDAQITVSGDTDRAMTLCEQAEELRQRLEAAGFYQIRSTIDRVAAGLGITAFGLDTDVTRLSGGQRAKVLLAKLLLQQPDVLLLDEPTNFLDADHIAWLTKYLNSFKGAFILVSHDFGFLDSVCNCICDIENGRIVRYNGSYTDFVGLKEARRAAYEKSYQSQQKEIKRLQTFIDKNIVRASTSAMAKSRRKRLEKMEKLEKPNTDPRPSFLFSYTPAVGQTILSVDRLAIGYDTQLVPELTLRLGIREKLAVTGFNGIGKSTFIKTICGQLAPLGGGYRLAERVAVGYYEQENLFADDGISALEQIKNWYPRLDDKQVHTALARCGLGGEKVLRPLKTLSGGEQAKVKLCRLTLQPYNLLILDEPTNHLDVNAIAQLQTAIKLFEGAVVFVSHSKAFCKACAGRTLDFEKLFDED